MQQSYYSFRCKEVVDDVNSGLGGTNAAIKEIELSARELLSCSFIHEGIESNNEAHSLTMRRIA
jgi:hypothetical protein